jgi:hypothetical protein
MKVIQSLTAEPRQNHILPIEGYADATLFLEFKETQYAWFMTLTWGGNEISGMRVASCPNLLDQCRSKFPFGLLVDSVNLQDPLTLDAFETGVCRMAILSEAEVVQVDEELYGA